MKNSHTSLKAWEKDSNCSVMKQKILNSDTEDAVLIDNGKLFHSLRPATAKARSPLHFNLALGTKSRCLVCDLRDLSGLCTTITSERYGGASLFRALYTNSRIFN